MTIFLLKLYSVFHETKEMLQVFLFQYFVVSYKTRPVIKTSKSNNKIINYVNNTLFILFLILRIFALVVVVFFKILKSLLIVKDKGIYGFGLSMIKIGLFLIPVSLISIYLYLSGGVDPARLKFYQDLHRYRTATAISDNHGNLIGVLATPVASPSRTVNHENGENTLYVNTIPNVFWEILKTQGDRELNFNYDQTGLIDVLSFRKKSYKGINILSQIGSFDFFSEKTVSNISLIENIINNLYENDFFDKKCSTKFLKSSPLTLLNYLDKKIIGVCKQVEYIQAGRHLFPYLARFNGLEFKRWTAMHTPTLVLNNSASGLRSISETVFGITSEKITDAQQALIATAYLHNIEIPLTELSGGNSLSQADKNNDLQQLIDYTIAEVKDTYSENETRANRIITALQKMTLPVQPSMQANVERYIRKLSLSKQQDYQDLRKRNKLFINGFDALLSKQLKKLYLSVDSNKIITDIIVTLPVVDNEKFKDNIDLAIKKVSDKCKTCFNTLRGKQLSSKSALMRIIVSDEQGKIIRYYKNGEILKRPIAGISKLPASILLASLGDTAKTKYCNQNLKRCTSSSNDKWRSLTFKDSYGLSQDLPFFYALTQKHTLSKDDFIKLYKDFSIEKLGKPSQSQFAYDLSYGKVESTTQEVHKFTHKITQTLFNSEFETDPFVIEQFQQADLNRSIEDYYSGAISSKNKIQKYFKLSSTKLQLRKILRDPVYNKNGTLSSFQNILGVHFLFAKSGTNLTENNSVKDKWAVGAFSLNGRIYTFLIFVGTDSNNEKGLGKNITHRSLVYPLMNEIIKSLSIIK